MKIAILGYGTVGSGAYEVAKHTPDIEVKHILVRRDPERMNIMTEDYGLILADEEIEVIAECIGGLTPSYEYIKAALEHGKNVVTPNKNLIAAHYNELMHLAIKNDVTLRFTSSAGGGIPWLYNLQRAKRCDDIIEVSGIVNGTCNYILDSMHKNGNAFDKILKEAQELGYAEADPSSDIDGFDTMHKCAISANIAFDTIIDEESVLTAGIRNIKAEDIAFFNENGLVCKMIMSAGIIDDNLYAYAEPTLFNKQDIEAAVGTNNNLISLVGKGIGKLSFYGQGAGKLPTGSSVIQDAIDVAKGINFSGRMKSEDAPVQEVENSIVKHRYYMHINRSFKEFPFDIIEKQKEDREDLYLISKPISVAEAHLLAGKFEDDTNPFFMAGIKESNQC